jgi:hypothetical protein
MPRSSSLPLTNPCVHQSHIASTPQRKEPVPHSSGRLSVSWTILERSRGRNVTQANAAARRIKFMERFLHSLGISILVGLNLE